jgi:hypothetical protein
MVRFTYLVELITLAGFFYNAIIILATLLANVGPGLQVGRLQAVMHTSPGESGHGRGC